MAVICFQWSPSGASFAALCFIQIGAAVSAGGYGSGFMFRRSKVWTTKTRRRNLSERRGFCRQRAAQLWRRALSECSNFKKRKKRERFSPFIKMWLHTEDMVHWRVTDIRTPCVLNRSGPAEPGTYSAGPERGSRTVYSKPSRLKVPSAIMLLMLL